LKSTDSSPQVPLRRHNEQSHLPLICTTCGTRLDLAADPIVCGGCRIALRVAVGGQLDLRPRSPRQAQLTVEIGGAPPALPPVELDANPAPELDLTGLELPPTISPRFASWMTRAPRAGALALDLGCGDARARPLIEHAGYDYVGVDLDAPEATYLADAHALPFAENTFDLVTTTAVIEYLRQPYLAMHEVHRVLKAGGRFIGSAGFLVPYLPVTYFHHTHMGILSALDGAGFRIERLLTDEEWTAFEATAQMAYFTRMPQPLLTALIRPLKALHRLWWALGNRFGNRPLTRIERQLRVAGDVEFIAIKG